MQCCTKIANLPMRLAAVGQSTCSSFCRRADATQGERGQNVQARRGGDGGIGRTKMRRRHSRDVFFKVQHVGGSGILCHYERCRVWRLS